jgi:hypothetical protein
MHISYGYIFEALVHYGNTMAYNRAVLLLAQSSSITVTALCSA